PLVVGEDGGFAGGLRALARRKDRRTWIARIGTCLLRGRARRRRRGALAGDGGEGAVPCAARRRVREQLVVGERGALVALRLARLVAIEGARLRRRAVVLRIRREARLAGTVEANLRVGGDDAGVGGGGGLLIVARA